MTNTYKMIEMIVNTVETIDNTNIVTKNSGRNITNPIIIKGNPMIIPKPVKLNKKPTSTARIPAILVPLLTIIKFSPFYQ